MKRILVFFIFCTLAMLTASFDTIEPVVITEHEIKIQNTEKVYTFFEPMIAQLQILKYYITALIFLLVADFVTGTRKAKSKGLAITSTGFRRSVSKFIEYSIAILSSHIFTWLFDLDITLSYYVAIYVCGTELYSIWENVSQTTGTNIKDYIAGFFPNIKDLIKKKQNTNDDTKGE
jgi:phage-related holin